MRRVLVALQTEAHLEALRLVREWHLVYPSVAAGAAHAFLHVDAVVEVDEACHIVHAVPLQRLANQKTLAHGLEGGTLSPDLGMAIHARLGRRDPREAAGLYRRVTVATVDTVVGNVVLVAERHGLIHGLADRRDVGRTHIQLQRRKQHGQASEAPNQTEPSKTIRAWPEDLRHALPRARSQEVCRPLPPRLECAAGSTRESTPG